jgi:hypothetical protein
MRLLIVAAISIMLIPSAFAQSNTYPESDRATATATEGRRSTLMKKASNSTRRLLPRAVCQI